MKCPRCEWTSSDETRISDRTQLQQHITDASHPCCISCDRVLIVGEEQACEDRIGENGRGCVARARELLSGILTCWADLHGEPRTWPRTAMLAGGGGGDMPRRLTPTEHLQTERWWLFERVGPLTRFDWKLAEAARAGKEHLADNLPGDPPDIRYELERWEDDFRHERGEPAANVEMQLERVEWWVEGAIGPLPRDRHRFMIRRGGPGASVRAAADYLSRHMRWAGRHHDAFVEFLEDMTVLHARCEAAVGRAPVKPEALDIVCLERHCTGHLQHPLVLVEEKRELRTWSGPAIDHKAHECSMCGRRYDDERLKVAKAETASRRSQVVVEGEVWQQVTRIAHDLGRSRQTVYSWIRRGQVRSFEEQGLVFVHVEDATTLHQEQPVRSKRQAS